MIPSTLRFCPKASTQLGTHAFLSVNLRRFASVSCSNTSCNVRCSCVASRQAASPAMPLVSGSVCCRRDVPGSVAASRSGRALYSTSSKSDKWARFRSKPEPSQSEPSKPEPIKPEPIKPEPAQQLVPAAEPTEVAAPEPTELVVAEEPSREVLAGGLDSVLKHPVLIVTREIEWAQLIVGFEQANKYSLRNLDGTVVGYMAEEDGIGKTVGRQLLKTHRGFKATVFDVHGTKVLEIDRPFYMVKSSMYVRDGDGAQLGEVHMNWHVYRRRYDLFVSNTGQEDSSAPPFAADPAPDAPSAASGQLVPVETSSAQSQVQFAAIDGGFLEWDFALRDSYGNLLAAVNKDWRGFAKELFTDANQYLVKMATVPAIAAPDSSDAPAAFEAFRELSIAERAVTLATAVTVDFDYFSRHSRGGGLFPWFMPIPVPIPPGAPAEVPTTGAGEAGAGDVAGSSGTDSAPADNYGTIGGEGVMRDRWAEPAESHDEPEHDVDDAGGDGEESSTLGVMWDTFKDFMGDDD
eukprot:TRINITY_DN4240_c0_g1_i1.p1 TRINITY_DN4240_c0_g1~~TRINITY_DN4240_c0_g1_i1.p1  ORF type:complete len:520 (+),score=178.91 TRINITY_DN4240_c0_g1_i1:935-2494(+)